MGWGLLCLCQIWPLQHFLKPFIPHNFSCSKSAVLKLMQLSLALPLSFSLVHMCVVHLCICMFACMWGYAYTCVSVHMCTLGVHTWAWCQKSSFITFTSFIEAEPLSQTQRSQLWLVLLVDLLLGSPVSAFWGWHYKTGPHDYCAFTWALGTWTLVFACVSRILTTEASPQPFLLLRVKLESLPSSFTFYL